LAEDIDLMADSVRLKTIIKIISKLFCKKTPRCPKLPTPPRIPHTEEYNCVTTGFCPRK
jgi:hypothetical protein